MATTEYSQYEYPPLNEEQKPLRGTNLYGSGFEEEERLLYEQLGVALGAMIETSYRQYLNQVLVLCDKDFKRNDKYLPGCVFVLFCLFISISIKCVVRQSSNMDRVLILQLYLFYSLSSIISII